MPRESNTYYDEEGEGSSYCTSDEYNSEDYDSEYGDSEDHSDQVSRLSMGIMDAEYEEFIEKYGHLDFHHLKFLPKIKTKQELVKEHFKIQQERQ